MLYYAAFSKGLQYTIQTNFNSEKNIMYSLNLKKAVKYLFKAKV